MLTDRKPGVKCQAIGWHRRSKCVEVCTRSSQRYVSILTDLAAIKNLTTETSAFSFIKNSSPRCPCKSPSSIILLIDEYLYIVAPSPYNIQLYFCDVHSFRSSEIWPQRGVGETAAPPEREARLCGAKIVALERGSPQWIRRYIRCRRVLQRSGPDHVPVAETHLSAACLVLAQSGKFAGNVAITVGHVSEAAHGALRASGARTQRQIVERATVAEAWNVVDPRQLQQEGEICELVVKVI